MDSSSQKALHRVQAILDQYADLDRIDEYDLTRIAIMLVGIPEPVSLLIQATTNKRMNRYGCRNVAESISRRAGEALRKQPYIWYNLQIKQGWRWKNHDIGMHQCHGRNLDTNLRGLAGLYSQDPQQIWEGRIPNFRFKIEIGVP